jgi:transcriptional regulator with XRE-family HTH domain
MRNAGSVSYETVASSRTNRPFADEVPRLLEERGWSIRHLAIEAGVERGYLWKVIRRRGYKTPSVRLTEAVAKALGLPSDYFPEYREGVVVDRVRRDEHLRDEVFDGLKQKRRP